MKSKWLRFGVSVLGLAAVMTVVGAFSLSNGDFLRFMEQSVNGQNWIKINPPNNITADRTCNLVDSANPIPDGCVGDGSDDDTLPTAGSAGIDVTGAAVSFDSTELGSLTFGLGSTFTWTFLAGGSESPQITFDVGRVLINSTPATSSPTLGIADEGDFKFYEENGSGTNWTAFKAPNTLPGNTTCTFQSDGKIPDTCIGNGVDDVAAGGGADGLGTDGDKGDVEVGTAGTTLLFDIISGDTKVNGECLLARPGGTGGEMEWATCPGGGGDNITVNAVAATDANFGTLPAAVGTGSLNVIWQKDTSTPNNVSAYVTAGSTSVTGVLALATNTEMFAGTDFAKALTSANLLALWGAGTDNAGGATITMGDGSYFNLITSGTAITAFTFGANDKAGRRASIRFNTIRTLTNNAAIIIPGGASITTAVGDIMGIRSLGSNNFVVEWYTRANGSTLIAYQPLDPDLTALAALSGTNSIYYRSAADTWTAVTFNAGVTFTGGAIDRAALTGDVTATANSNATEIADNAVENADIRDSSALSVIGRSVNSSGDPGDIAATAATDSVLRESGNVIGWGTVATAGIANSAITDAKLRTSAALSVVGRSANSTGNVADIATTAGSGAVLRESGAGVLGFGTIGSAGITDSTIALADLANIATDKLIGRDAAGTGVPEVIGVTGGIEFDGSLNIRTTAFTGDITKTAGGTTLTIASDVIIPADMNLITAQATITSGMCLLARPGGAGGELEFAACPGGGGGLASTDIDTSLELDTIVTDNTGSGALVFGTAPDLTISATTETNIESAIDTLNNLTLTGTPTATTATSGDNDTSVATTAFVTDAVLNKKESLCIAASDETTDLTTGAAKVTWRMPYAFTLTTPFLRASVNDAPTGTLVIDVNEGGVTLMTTTKLTIDTTEETSVTAAAQPGVTDTSLVDDAEMTIGITTLGTTAKGLKVCLIGHQT